MDGYRNSMILLTNSALYPKKSDFPNCYPPSVYLPIPIYPYTYVQHTHIPIYIPITLTIHPISHIKTYLDTAITFSMLFNNLRVSFFRYPLDGHMHRLSVTMDCMRCQITLSDSSMRVTTMQIQFKGKIRSCSYADGTLAYRYIDVPQFTRKHCDMHWFRTSRKYGFYANSDLFPSFLARLRKELLTGQSMRLDKLPANVTVDESGFLAVVSVSVSDT